MSNDIIYFNHFNWYVLPLLGLKKLLQNKLIIFIIIFYRFLCSIQITYRILKGKIQNY